MTILYEASTEASTAASTEASTAASTAATAEASTAATAEGPSRSVDFGDGGDISTPPASASGGSASDPQAATANLYTNPILLRQVSVSEAAERSGTGLTAPVWLSWLEFPFHVPDPVTGQKLPEAAGWAMDSVGRGPLNQVGSYVGAAILRSASREAGGGTVYGFKPSSLLTLSTSLVGVVAALMMPIVGAVVDHTRYRRFMGIASGFLSVAFIGGQIFINENNWFAMLIVDACQTFVYLIHTTSVFAYLPDLSLDPDVISHYTSRFTFRQFAGQFIYVSLIIICGTVRGTDRTVASTIQTARDAAGIAFGFGALFIGYAWLFLFRKRPALSAVAEGETLITTGFKQVSKTGRTVWKNYRGLRWFMLSLLWSPEAGAGVILSIAVTFLTVKIQMTGQEIAKTSLCLMAGNLVGSLLSKKICALINPLNSYRAGMMCLAGCIGLSALWLDAPRRVFETYVTAGVWGISMGWTYPSQRVLFCTLIPKGQETEFMGLFVFVGQILGWLPSLIFTLMNEKGANLGWGLAMVGMFCALSVAFTLPMGSYEAACQQAQLASQEKLNAVVEATSKRPKGANETTDDLVSLEEDNRKAEKTVSADTQEAALKLSAGERDNNKREE
jgi:MFS-type transporter involved in bile tolerance (Atg22 family)